jgi:hypothetical protein
MKALVGLAFCFLLGLSIRGQGWSAVLWVPVGFAFGLFASAQILLPILMGLPTAAKRVIAGDMRPAVFGAIFATPVIWVTLIVVIGFCIGYFSPSTARDLYNNLALNLSMSLGTLAIILSPLSAESRADFAQDFERTYGRFNTNAIDYDER